MATATLKASVVYDTIGKCLDLLEKLGPHLKWAYVSHKEGSAIAPTCYQFWLYPVEVEEFLGTQLVLNEANSYGELEAFLTKVFTPFLDLGNIFRSSIRAYPGRDFAESSVIFVDMFLMLKSIHVDEARTYLAKISDSIQPGQSTAFYMD